MPGLDWLELWRELVQSPRAPDNDRIKRYREHARRGWHRPDPLLDFVLESVDQTTSVLDIGAGDGRWSIPLARKARSVTAVEPDGDMRELLQDNLKRGGENVRIITGAWEEAETNVHDIAVCAHAIYSSPDFSLFIRKMEQHARKACYLAMRLPPVDGVISELTRSVYGRAHDSVNAVVAYNALYALGIYANVVVEDEILRWTNTTQEEALKRAKRHLRLESSDQYDVLIRETLKRRLTAVDGEMVWPDGMRSALLWWKTKE